MRRYISYIAMCATLLIGIGASVSPLMKTMNSDLAYADGKTLYFKASHYEENSVNGNYQDFLAAEDINASGQPVINDLANTVKARLDNWGMSEYEVKVQGYDTIAVSLRTTSNSETQYTYLEQYLSFSGGDYELDASDTTHDGYTDSDLLKTIIDDQTATIENIDMGSYKVPVVVVPLKSGDDYKEAFTNLLKYCNDNTKAAETDSSGNETSAAQNTLLVVWANRKEDDTYDKADKDVNVKNRILTVEATTNDNAVWYQSSDTDKETPYLQLIPTSEAISSDGNYNPSKTKEAYEAAVFLRNMFNASNLGDYRLTFTYSEKANATVENLISVGDYAISPALSKTLISTIIVFVFLCILLVLFDRIFALAEITSTALSSFGAFGLFVAFGSQFNIAALLGIMATGLVALFGALIYSSRLKDEIYKGRTLKKASQEAAKKSVLPVIDAGVVSIILGTFVYLFAGDLASKFGVMLVGGGLIATLVNLVFLRLAGWLLCTDNSMQSSFVKQLNINGEKIPDLVKEEKQTYFGPYQDKDFSKGKLWVGIVTSLFVLAGIGTMIGFGVKNGDVYNDAAYKQSQTVLRIDVRSEKSEYITVSSLSDVAHLFGKDATGDSYLLDSIKIDDKALIEYVSNPNEDIKLSETPKAIYETADAGTGKTYYWFYYEIKLNTYLPLTEENGGDKMYSISTLDASNTWSAPTSLGLNDAITNFIENRYVRETADYISYFATVTPEIGQPYLGSVALGVGIGILISVVYLVLRYGISRALSMGIVVTASSYIAVAFFVIARISTSPVVALGSVGVALVGFLLALFIATYEKELVASTHAKERGTVEFKLDVVKKSTSRQAGILIIFALLAAYVGIVYFAFGPIYFMSPYLSFILGLAFALATTLTLYPFLYSCFVKMFSHIKIKPLKKKKKNAGGQLTKKKKSAEPEEAIFIGIND